MNPRFLVPVVLALTAPATASGSSWPDGLERTQMDLSARDAPTRLTAARRLRTLGVTAAPLVLQALDDADPGVRLIAADAAVHLRVPGATERVASWLNAPDVHLRLAACEIAAAVPDSRVVAPLARTLGDQDAGVRELAARALGRQTSAEAVAPLVGRLDDPAPPVRIAIAGALGRLGDARGVVPLIGKVEDSSPEMRRQVARSLGSLGDPRAAAALTLDLRDQDSDVRREATTALGRLRAQDAIDAIAPLVSDRSPELRAAAAEALGRIATGKALAVLTHCLGGCGEADLDLDRTPVRDALVDAGTEAIPLVATLLNQSRSGEAAAGAAWVLGAMHAHAQSEDIVAALRRGTLAPTAALHALAGAGTSADLPVVLELVSDKNPAVRREALAAAQALLDPKRPDGRAIDPLAAALASPVFSDAEREEIVTLLGRTGSARAAPLLADLTKANSVEMQTAAIDALGTLGPAGADDALLARADSTDGRVRLHAAEALSESGGPRARDALLALLSGRGDIDRAAALTALAGILSRAPSDGAVSFLSTALETSAGPERDALIEAIGRAKIPSATRVLAEISQSTEPLDRSETASACGARSGDPGATAIVRALARDADAGVRAQAAWTLGAIGEDSDAARLQTLTRDPEMDVAANAAASLGRLSARARGSDLAARALCPLVEDLRAYVRANALAGLAVASASCGGGTLERTALAGDLSEQARFAAALAVRRRGQPDDLHALDRCADTDPSVEVAKACRTPAPLSRATTPVRVYVVPEGSRSPRPGAPYALLLTDGMLHLGMADRRGAVFEAVAPEGFVRLAPPWPSNP